MFSVFGGPNLVRFVLGGVLAGILVSSASVPFAAAQEVVTDEMIANADLDKGKRVFLRCRSCHTIADGEPHKQGPNLHGVFGRKVGSVDDFKNYSDALKTADFIWSRDQLDAWLQSPREFLPGNRMSFVGLPKEDDRVNLIAYLLAETGGEAAVEPAADDAESESEGAVDEGATGQADPASDAASDVGGADEVSGADDEATGAAAPASEPAVQE